MSGTHRGRPRGSGPPIQLKGTSGGMNLPSMNMNMNLSSNAVASKMTKTAESLFSNHLASALNTFNDSQFFQDSISPSTIRHQFETSDPSNPNSTPTLMNNMKWLLASMSKGRDVSDFFSHVVKLVSCQSLEIRKMVYTYLTHYADHNSTCRDLALLSINAFQRDLSDSNPTVRPLALRVLTSIRVMDVLQIQILAVQSCGKDSSPHVRKCAANALAKLYPRTTDDDTKIALKEILKEILHKENCTMVLSSAMVSFVEMCPQDLDMLHGCYRKLCHLLTDMDEWGQIVVMDVLQRYCRVYFRRPDKVGQGSAEVIDRQRSVVRSIREDGSVQIGGVDLGDDLDQVFDSANAKPNNNQETKEDPLLTQQITNNDPPKRKRRVVRKGFYSDEEDESSEEEISITFPRADDRLPGQSLASALRQPINTTPRNSDLMDNDNDRNKTGFGGVADATSAMDEDEDLDEDHRLLLRSSLPLLKSRNSGVVLGVCSLHYYCGVASIKIRSALGKALVRIYHDRREIQFIVLNSIRALVWECPSAFTPFLNDFFVKAMDPSFTRLVKLDILCALCLQPNAIDAVLNELKTYIRHDDKDFVCASVRAVGKLVEMARIVHDRHGNKTGNAIASRHQANTIALNCLYGLVTLSEVSDNENVLGECVSVMQRIIMLLQSDAGVRPVNDPNNVQETAMKRLLLFVVRSLTEIEDNTEDEFEEKTDSPLMAIMELPSDKIAPALWILGEWLSSNIQSFETRKISKTEENAFRTELLRLLANKFPEVGREFKCQTIHFASKILLSDCSQNDIILCEFILSLGRLDSIHDVRDRARNESLIIHMSKGINLDADTMPTIPVGGKRLTINEAKTILLSKKPASSWLPIDFNDENNTNIFRLGTLSSMISRKAGDAYYALPPWAAVDSAKSLRDPPRPDPPASKAKSNKKEKDGWRVNNAKTTTGFYDSDSSSSSSDSSNSSDSSSSSSSSSESSSSGESSSSDDESTSSEESTADIFNPNPPVAPIQPVVQRRQIMPTPVVNDQPLAALDESSEDGSSSDESESSSSSGSDDSSDEESSVENTANIMQQNASSLIDVSFDNKKEAYSVGQKLHYTDSRKNSSIVEVVNVHRDDELVPFYDIRMEGGKVKQTDNAHLSTLPSHISSHVSSITSGLEGLVMAPLVVDKNAKYSSVNMEEESSAWQVLVRHDLSGGLEMTARYLRGAALEREANLIGFDPKNPAIVCLQVKFENKRTDGRAIRRIHLMQKKFSKSGVIPTSRISVPQEISSLDEGKVSYATLGLEFAHASDKDASLHTKFDVKCDRGTTLIDICPPLAETITSSSFSRSNFDSALNSLRGIHQQAKGSFTLSPTGNQSYTSYIPEKVLKASNFSLVETWINGHCKFGGRLPQSGNPVLMDIEYDLNSGKGSIQVNCDSAMALNPLLSYFKSILSS